MPDLNEVMDMYNQGMPQPIPRSVLKNHQGAIPESSHLLSPLGLTEEEKQAVIAFLGALSSEEAKLP
jgi:cytochrome c peroxidase